MQTPELDREIRRTRWVRALLFSLALMAFGLSLVWALGLSIDGPLA